MSSVTSTSSSSNVMRMTGMATGMDTDAMVKAMTANYQTKIDKANQDQQVIQWKQEAYRDIIKDIKNLQDYFDPLSSKYIMSDSKFNPTKVTNTNEGNVGITASATALPGNYKVTVSQLAKPAVLQGGKVSDTATGSTKLSTLGLNAGTIDFNFTVNGTAAQASVDVTGKTIQDVVDDINKQLKDKKVTASFDELSKKFVFSTSTSGTSSSLSLTVTGGSNLGLDSVVSPNKLQGSVVAGATSSTKIEDIGVTDGSQLIFNINGKSVTTAAVDSTTTIQNVLDTINNDSNIKSLGVTASFDETSKKFVFATNGSGTASSINVSVTSNNADLAKAATDISSLGLSAPLTAPTSATGQNAEFKLNYPDGRTELLEQSSNQFTANGITYNLKAIGSSDITVAKNDVDSVVTNIKSFLTDYNNIIGKIQGKLTEKKQYTYKPLTDEQKKDMKETDITNWETKAKQGILKNDSYLQNMLTNLRSVFGDGVYSSVTSVGITGHSEGSNKVDGTKNEFVMGIYGDGALGLDTSKEVSEAGKIIIKDETKLRAAIAKDPEEFTKFFIQKSITPLDKDANGNEKEYVGSKTYFEDGIFSRMDKMIRNYAGDPGIGKDGTSTLKGNLNIFANKQYDFSMSGGAGKNTMPDQIYAKALSISKLQTTMSTAQEKYYKKFAALETAMNNMNAQMSNFKSQMGIS